MKRLIEPYAPPTERKIMTDKEIEVFVRENLLQEDLIPYYRGYPNFLVLDQIERRFLACTAGMLPQEKQRILDCVNHILNPVCADWDREIRSIAREKERKRENLFAGLVMLITFLILPVTAIIILIDSLL